MSVLARGMIENAAAAKTQRDYDDTIYDLVFVLNISGKGWILERVCRVIEAHSGLHCGWVFSETNHQLPADLPPARAYFYAHYNIAANVYAKYPNAARAKNFVYFTHPDFSHGIKAVDMLMAFEHFDKVFCMNSAHVSFLQNLGVEQQKLALLVGGFDSDAFKPSLERGNKVGLVGGYYKRKNPKLMLRVVKANPRTEFLLIEGHPTEVQNEGIFWLNSPYAERIKRLKNLRLVQARYVDYPAWYHQMDIYLSLSSLEGGPISLLEAMGSNVFPICTRTGFAEDVIVGPDTGILLPNNPTLEDVNSALKRARKRRLTQVAHAVSGYSWSALGRRVAECMGMAAVVGTNYSLGRGSVSSDWFGAGWHSREKDGAWSMPGTAKLGFPVASATKPSCVVLQAYTRSAAEHIPIKARVNGTEAAELTFNTKARQLEIPIPAGVDWRWIDIELECAHYFVPSKAGVSETDHRELSLFASVLTVQ